MYKITIEQNGETIQMLEADSLIVTTNSMVNKGEGQGDILILGMNDLNVLVTMSVLTQTSVENILKAEITRHYPEQFKGLNEEQAQMLLQQIILELFQQVYQQMSHLSKQLPSEPSKQH